MQKKIGHYFTVILMFCCIAGCEKTPKSAVPEQSILLRADLSSAAQRPTKPVSTKPNTRPHKSPSLGVGLAGINDWSSGVPFIDLMKQSRAWDNWAGGNKSFDIDDHGWIKKLSPSQEAGTVFLVTEQALFSRAVVLYEGEGTLEYRWAANKIDAESTAGHDLINLGVGNHLMVITATNPDNPIRNIRIIPEEFLDVYISGEIFNPVWISRVNQFSAVRFMDWMGTNNSQNGAWNERPKVDDRTWAEKGAPLEIMLKLANQMLVNPWFNIPHLADKNYIDSFSTLVHKTLDPRLTVFVEYSNEVWNWSFEQANYANTMAEANWGKAYNGRMQWHGMKTAQICDSFKRAEFSESVNRVKCVLSVQTGWHGIEVEAFTCPDWKEGAPCYKHGIDMLGITGYFNGGLNGPDRDEDPYYEKTMLDLASKGEDGIALAFEQMKDGKLLSGTKEYKDFKGVVADIKFQLDYWIGVANKYNLELVAYEGGQHMTANARKLQDQQSVTDFYIALNRDPKMTAIYTDALNAWKAGGGGLFMHFVDVSSYSKWGSWGGLEYFSQVSSPKWDAITRFNSDVKCWWPDCDILLE